MTEIYKMVDSKNEEISELFNLIQKKHAKMDRLKSENEYLRNNCDAIKKTVSASQNFLKMTVPSNFIRAYQIMHRLSFSSTLLRLRMDIS